MLTLCNVFLRRKSYLNIRIRKLRSPTVVTVYEFHNPSNQGKACCSYLGFDLVAFWHMDIWTNSIQTMLNSHDSMTTVIIHTTKRLSLHSQNTQPLPVGLESFFVEKLRLKSSYIFIFSVLIVASVYQQPSHCTFTKNLTINADLFGVVVVDIFD